MGVNERWFIPVNRSDGFGATDWTGGAFAACLTESTVNMRYSFGAG
jgi:hypothetical protein